MSAAPQENDPWIDDYRRTREVTDLRLKIQDGEASPSDLDRFILLAPEEAESMLKGYHLLLGDKDAPRDDIRIGTVPITAHLDTRRFSLGLDSLDSLAGQVRPREFIVCGAYPGHGKTSYGERVALNNALLGHKTLFATLEMEREDVRDRIIAKLVKGSVDSVYAARQLGSVDMILDAERMLRDELRELFLWHPLRKERTIQSITKRAQDLGAEFLIIDYTRKLSGWAPGEKAREIVDYLWDWIKYTQISTLLFSQLKAPIPGRQRRPTIADYQDTSELQHSATRAMILWRPFNGRPTYDSIIEFIMGKNRRGPAFMCHAHWIGEFGDILPMDEHDEEFARCCKRWRKKDEQGS